MIRPARLVTLALLSIVVTAPGCSCGDDNDDVPDASTIDSATGADADPAAPAVTDVDYPVIAHGGQLVITGVNLATATTVSIGGTEHAASSVTDTSVTIDAVLDATPVGLTQPLIVNTGLGTTPAFDITVIHLIINELEIDSPGADVAEFIELDIGLTESVSLAGYVAVLFQGNSANGDVISVIDLDGSGATTDATGLLLIGSSALPATAQIDLPGPNAIQNGEDALAIYQIADPLAFPADLNAAGTTGLLDALVYESNDDTDAPVLYPLLLDAVAVVVDEGPTTEARDTVSMQRCPDDVSRRLGASYRLEVPTPGQANVNCAAAPAALADCTIDFTGVCPDVVGGECGAVFFAHGVGACEAPGVAACTSAAEGFHSTAADERIDIFLHGNLDTLETFLAPFQDTDATMRFFTLDGTEVGTALTVADDCNVATPPANNTADLGGGAVRRIQINGNSDVFIDNFHVNP